MEARVPTSLFGAAREFWRFFARAWIFPLALLLFTRSGLLSQKIFMFLVLPLFFFVFFRATLPLMRHEVSYWHTVFWSIVVPFLIWCCAVFGSGLLLSSWGKT